MSRVVLSPFGSITKSHGLKGAVQLKHGSLKISSENPPRELWLGESAQNARPWAVEYLHLSNKNAYLKLREINTRQEADYLSGLQVFITAATESENIWDELVGYKVRVEKSSVEFGVIQTIDETNPQALFVVQSDSGTFLVPAVSELIEQIDHERKTIHFKNIEGLLPV